MKRFIASIFLVAGMVSVLPGQTYTISTVAGSANNIFGDGGNAAAAIFIQPIGIAIDGAGNTYISDLGGAIQAPGRIRKVDGVTGNITTLTVATASPTGLALDSTGKFLYVAGQNSARVYKVDTTTGATTTVLGTGSADASGAGHLATQTRIRQPQCVWIAPNNDIYACDTLNNRILRVDAASGIAYHFAGRGGNNTTPALPAGNLGLTVNNTAGDGGLAVRAQLSIPQGVIGDASGNIYIADTNFNRIRKVDTKGIITTVVGVGTAGASANAGAAAGPVGDQGDALSAALASPIALAWDPNGNLIIADSATNRVRLWNPTTNILRTIAGGGNIASGNKLTDEVVSTISQLNTPSGVAVDKAGNILITDTGNARIRKIDIASGGIVLTAYGSSQGRGDGGDASYATFNNPRGVAVDDDGNIYVSDTGNNRIRKVDTTGLIGPFAGKGTNGLAFPENTLAANATLSSPGCVSVDPSGSVYIADRVNSRIRKVDVYGNITTVAGGTSLTTNAAGIVTGNAVATGYYNDGVAAVLSRIGLVTTQGVFSAGTATAANASSPNNGPGCVSADGQGNLYVADTANHVVRKVTPGGMITTVVGFPIITTNAQTGQTTISGQSGSAGDGGLAVNAQLNTPQGVGVNRAGTLLCVADTSNHAVRMVDLKSGIITLISGIIPDGGSDALPANGWQSRLNLPQGCAVDDNGNTYIADNMNHRIILVDSTGKMSLIAGGGTLYASDGKPATQALLNLPSSINVDKNGNVYFTDRFGLVRKLTPDKK